MSHNNRNENSDLSDLNNMDLGELSASFIDFTEMRSRGWKLIFKTPGNTLPPKLVPISKVPPLPNESTSIAHADFRLMERFFEENQKKEEGSCPVCHSKVIEGATICFLCGYTVCSGCMETIDFDGSIYERGTSMCRSCYANVKKLMSRDQKRAPLVDRTDGRSPTVEKAVAEIPKQKRADMPADVSIERSMELISSYFESLESGGVSSQKRVDEPPKFEAPLFSPYTTNLEEQKYVNSLLRETPGLGTRVLSTSQLSPVFVQHAITLLERMFAKRPSISKEWIRHILHTCSLIMADSKDWLLSTFSSLDLDFASNGISQFVDIVPVNAHPFFKEKFNIEISKSVILKNPNFLGSILGFKPFINNCHSTFFESDPNKLETDTFVATNLDLLLISFPISSTKANSRDIRVKGTEDETNQYITLTQWNEFRKGTLKRAVLEILDRVTPNIIISSDSVDLKVKKWFASAGVLVISNVKEFHLKWLARVSGASIVSSIRQINRNHLGFIKQFLIREILSTNESKRLRGSDHPPSMRKTVLCFLTGFQKDSHLKSVIVRGPEKLEDLKFVKMTMLFTLYLLRNILFEIPFLQDSSSLVDPDLSDTGVYSVTPGLAQIESKFQDLALKKQRIVFREKNARDKSSPVKRTINFYYTGDSTIRQYFHSLYASVDDIPKFPQILYYYLLGEYLISVSIVEMEEAGAKEDRVTTWLHCMECGADTPRVVLQAGSLSLSFGKFLETSFQGTKIYSAVCGHSSNLLHTRFFGYRNAKFVVERRRVMLHRITLPKFQCSISRDKWLENKKGLIDYTLVMLDLVILTLSHKVKSLSAVPVNNKDELSIAVEGEEIFDEITSGIERFQKRLSVQSSNLAETKFSKINKVRGDLVLFFRRYNERLNALFDRRGISPSSQLIEEVSGISDDSLRERLQEDLLSTNFIFHNKVAINMHDYTSLILSALHDPGYLEKMEEIGVAESPRKFLLYKGPVEDYVVVHDNPAFIVKVLFPVQFEALRRMTSYGPAGDNPDLFYSSMYRSSIWLVKGGKSGSAFEKTLDERYVVKHIQKIEFKATQEKMEIYFKYIHSSLGKDMELHSALCKILGLYEVTYKRLQGKRHYLLLMENLFYDANISLTFDFKGSKRNRFVKRKKRSTDVDAAPPGKIKPPSYSGSSLAEKGSESEILYDSTIASDVVLLDMNLQEYLYNSPLLVREREMFQLRTILFDDSLFLSRHFHVMDYSLLTGIDRTKQEIKVGIIDYLREYTIGKQIESVLKTTISKKDIDPTVINPQKYKIRFRDAIDTYFFDIPDLDSGLDEKKILAQRKRRNAEDVEET